ncbi:hypothetical protein FVE85_1762 [Porphyridium purpureum]|uniref:Uncharacterized protein n=1 Tax=Porphyridium purpureum TaxID=35688 RepID=A0A5J4YYR9_PORPP|nr:hypothetical protein FVE85_1762 [Porphyridium purpureum]|eukprot:POR6932..scf209_3
MAKRFVGTGTSKPWWYLYMEAWKFAMYVSIPVGSVYALTQTNMVNRIVMWTQYVVYPREGPRPPSADDMLRLLADERKRREENDQGGPSV